MGGESIAAREQVNLLALCIYCVSCTDTSIHYVQSFSHDSKITLNSKIDDNKIIIQRNTKK